MSVCNGTPVKTTHESLLAHLGYPQNVVLMHAETGKIETRTVANRKQWTSTTAAWVQQQNARGWNIYGEANESCASDRRSSTEDINRLRVVVGDIDAKDGRSKDDCLKAIRKLPVEPTFIVDTGGGYQVWWFYDEPLEAAPENVARHVAIGRAIAQATGGDAVYDVARMMRLPGYTNWPNAAKRKRGRVPTPVKVVGGCAMTGQIYTLDELEEAFQAELAALSQGRGVALPAGLLDDLNSDLTGGLNTNWFDKLSDGDKYAFLKAALTDPDIVALADAPRDEWLKVVAALARSGVPGAYDLGLEWSRTSDRFTSEADYSKTFRSFEKGRDGGIGPGTFIYIVESHGFDTAPFKALADGAGAGGSGEGSGSSAPKDLIGELNADYAWVQVGGQARIYEFKTGTLLQLETFRSKHATKKIDGKGAGTVWLTDPRRRTYDRFEFHPDGRCSPDVLNAYMGFGVDAVPGEVWPWILALRAVVPDKVVAEYILLWLALKVQKPATVPGTILVVTGPQGAGKSALFRALVQMFAPHSDVYAEAEQVVGQFTWHLRDKLFAVVEEAVFVGDPRHTNKIKARVTAREMSYEMKGVTPVRGENYCNYVLLTNNVHAWQATVDERRAVVVDAGDKLRGNRAFWNRYHAWLEAGGAGALLHYLRHVEVRGFDPRAIPKSSALKRQMALTLGRSDPVAAWWASVLADECFSDDSTDTELVDGRPILKRDLQNSYEHAVKGTRAPKWPQAIQRLHELVAPGKIIESRPRAGAGQMRTLSLPPLAKMRKAFEKHTGVRAENTDL